MKLMSSSAGSCRHAFASRLHSLAVGMPNLYVVSSDSAGSAVLGDFSRDYPGQFVEVGIAEQNAVGMASGLARCGKTVFVCGPASFYAARSLDQVKVDVAYARTDVKIIGISGGVSYGPLGGTHHALHDSAVMRAIPDLEVFIPADSRSTAAVTGYLAGSGKPAYMRLGRGPVPVVYKEDPLEGFHPGKANRLRSGQDVALLAVGETVAPTLAAAELLAMRGIRALVLDMWSLKPMDEGAIIDAALCCPCLVSVEEHSIHGGMGAAVAQVLGRKIPRPLQCLGIPDEWAPAGSSAEIFHYYGLSAEGIAESVERFVIESGRWSS